MGRTARDNRDRPHPQPVERIELSEDHLRFRVIAVVVFLVLGLGTLGYSLLRLLGSNQGWETIEVNNGSLGDVSKEFVLQYRLGAADLSPTAEKKALTLVYSDAVRRAWLLFYTAEKSDEVIGLTALNERPNEELTIDQALYDALERVTKDGNRAIYLGPLYGHYDSLFASQSDQEATEVDPLRNPAVKEEIERLVSFASDPAMIELRCLGDCRVLLSVSAEYQAYLKESWEETYLDFGWMRNAFIADYIADRLTEQGLTHGVLSSQDGFVRNLYDGKEEASYTLLRRSGNEIQGAGTMKYSGARSLLFFHDYPLSEAQEAYSYYCYEDGTVRAPYVDPADGMLKAAAHEMLLYTDAEHGSLGCSELLMEAMQCYVGEKVMTTQLASLESRGIMYLLFDGEKILTNDVNLKYEPE